MVNRKTLWIIGALVVILMLGVSLMILRSPEDTWIKNEQGVYTAHGSPSEKPFYVSEQETAIVCAKQIYSDAAKQGVSFSSQCLGSCGNYAVDIVNVPRTSEDNLEANQCEEYLKGNDKNFIELDKDGNIVRIM